MNKGDSVFILFLDGKAVKDPRFKNKLKTYKSRESYHRYRGERSGEELVEYVPAVEADWLDVTKPGQITCGGNPVYACGRCGDIYGSFEIIPSAKYCRACGAKMRLKGRLRDERVN